MGDNWGPDDALEAPDPERQRRARERARIARRLVVLDLCIVLVGLLALVLSGAGEWLRDRLQMHWALQAPIYAAILAGAYTALSFPFEVYGGYVVPRRYGLLTQSLRAWLKDRLKALALGAVLAFGLIEILYGFLHAGGGWWWIWTALAYTVVSVVMTVVGPTLIFPIFYKVRPLEDEELVERIKRLADRAGARVRGVYLWQQSEKGTTANAALMGLGKTRRVVLSDTLLSRYSKDEIEVILAHELGHHVHRDIPKAVVIGAITTFASFWVGAQVLRWGVDALGFRGVTDVAALPLLLLTVSIFGFVIGPVAKAYSRHAETRADVYALESTRTAGEFVSMMAKLTDQNLGEAEPPAWARLLFYDHPTPAERISAARRYQAGAGLAI